MENTTGHVLVRRSRPVAPTQAGRVLNGLAQQVALATADATAILSGVKGGQAYEMVRLSLAINADSLSTWFRPVIAQLAQERRILLDLHIEDQDHTDVLLREGEVMAAVTTSANPPPGCQVEPLGSMTYWPTCAPSLLAGRVPKDCHPGSLPMLRFDLKDDLQHAYLRQAHINQEPPIHYIPSNHEFLTAARLGLGWGVLPDGQVRGDLTNGTLVLLEPQQSIIVPLYWQRWRVPYKTVAHVTTLAKRAAQVGLSH
jgi:LysR family transcriptional regulator (chromosome initiation inhibitor)